MKFFDLVNVSAACKRFFMITTVRKKFRRTVSISKRIFNFDDYYTDFLHNQMLDLKVDIQKKFKEEISSEIFSIIFLKIKRISYELTPFRVFCHWCFCTRGSRSTDTCSICSRIFIGNNDIAKKLNRVFVITRNLIENHDIFHLMKYFSA